MNQPPYAGPTPPPRRERPRKAWFFVGGGLILLAFVVFGGALVLTLWPLTQEDASFAASDTPVEVHLPADTERALFANTGFSVDCTATDGAGAEVEFRPVTGELTVNQWTALSRFDTGDGNLTFDCVETSPGSQVRIGDLPSAGGFVAGLVVGILVPLVLGLIGLVMLIVTSIRWATGAPRDAA